MLGNTTLGEGLHILYKNGCNFSFLLLALCNYCSIPYKILYAGQCSQVN